jgi:hypothetical protein
MSKELIDCRTEQEAVDAVRRWISAELPEAWRRAGEQGGPGAVRLVRTPDEYRAWYPAFARTGLVAAQWPHGYGGLGWDRRLSQAAERTLAPYHLPRLNPLGLNLAAPALFAHGTEEQRLRFLPKIVSGEEIWCQLFSEPGAGSDLASLATRAERDGDHWRITGQKVWTTWAHLADFGVLLARTDPGVPKREGITYFLIDMHQPGVQVRPLRHIGGEVDFNEVFLDGAIVGDAQRVGAVGDGWKVARATLSGERQMVSGAALAGSTGSAAPAPAGSSGWPTSAPRKGCPAAGMTSGCASGWSGCGARSRSGPGPTRGSGRGSRPACPRDQRARSARWPARNSISGCRRWRPRCSGCRAPPGPVNLARTPSRCRPRCVACCAAGQTPSRAARPR